MDAYILERAVFLAHKIQGKLTDDLRRKPWRGHPHPYAGHCYVASEVLYHALGGAKTGIKPMFIYHEGAPHWFLAKINGTSMMILDVTSGQFATPVPWAKAKGKGFLTKKPSKRAKILLRRISL